MPVVTAIIGYVVREVAGSLLATAIAHVIDTSRDTVVGAPFVRATEVFNSVNHSPGSMSAVELPAIRSATEDVPNAVGVIATPMETA